MVKADNQHRVLPNPASLRVMCMPAWRRCAVLCATICWIVACVPPNGGTWSSPQPQGRYDYEHEHDYEDEEYANDGAWSAGPSSAGPQSSTRNTGSTNACVPVCRRIVECKLMSGPECADNCARASAAGLAPAASHARDSCGALGALLAKGRSRSAGGTRATGGSPPTNTRSSTDTRSPPDTSSRGVMWYCTAEGSYSTGGYGTEIEQGIHAMNKGPTRDDANLAAFRDCNSLMTASLSINDPARVVADCRVTRCWWAK
jgi:hypothetical protein